MKRIFLFTITLILVFSLSGCALLSKILPVREYRGTPLTSLSYKTVNYMGGTTVNYVFDFNENTVNKTTYNPYNEEGQEYNTTLVCEFTEEAELEFINTVYSYGLFNLKESYKTNHVIMDGGGWELVIEYSDGSSKKSSGSNAGPSLIFRNCAIPFYDLTGIDILGGVPTSYYSPPTIDFSVSYRYKDHYYVGNTSIDVFRGNYLWNGHEKSNVNIYELATTDRESGLLSDAEYSLGMSTTNYHNYNGSYKRFDECVVMSYDIDPELTNGKEILRAGWFDSVSIPYEPNRIYIVTIYFDNGDFTQFGFSTATLDQKIHYGEYTYNIYSKGRSVLMINEDGSFRLDPFDYFEESDRAEGESNVSLYGKWAFETINDAEFLVLTAESGERIVFDYCALALFLDFEKTALDMEKYNLDGDPEELNGRVSFNKH